MCEFRKCAIKKITIQSLVWSLRACISNLRELCVYDINVSKGILRNLDLDLDGCSLEQVVMKESK